MEGICNLGGGGGEGVRSRISEIFRVFSLKTLNLVDFSSLQSHTFLLIILSSSDWALNLHVMCMSELSLLF